MRTCRCARRLVVGGGGQPRLDLMPASPLVRTLARAAAKAPGIKRLPVVKLLVAAEVAVLARDHVQRLTPAERRRVLELVRIGRGRPSNLAEADREELSALVAKAEPRLLAGQAVDALSPFPLPRRLVYGRRAR
jgi:hypothetical protein